MANEVHRRAWKGHAAPGFDPLIGGIVTNASLTIGTGHAPYGWTFSATSAGPTSGWTSGALSMSSSLAAGQSCMWESSQFALPVAWQDLALTSRSSGWVGSFGLRFYGPGGALLGEASWAEDDAMADGELLTRIALAADFPSGAAKASFFWRFGGDGSPHSGSLTGIMLEPAVESYRPPSLGVGYAGMVYENGTSSAGTADPAWLQTCVTSGGTGADLQAIASMGVQTVFCALRLERHASFNSGGDYVGLESYVVPNWRAFLGQASAAGLGVVAFLFEPTARLASAASDAAAMSGFQAMAVDLCAATSGQPALKAWGTVMGSSGLRGSYGLSGTDARSVCRGVYSAIKIADYSHPVTVLDGLTSGGREPWLSCDGSDVARGPEWQDGCVDFYCCFAGNGTPLSKRIDHLSKPVAFLCESASGTVMADFSAACVAGVECVAPWSATSSPDVLVHNADGTHALGLTGTWIAGAEKPQAPSFPLVATVSDADLLSDESNYGKSWPARDLALFAADLTDATSGVGGTFVKANLEAKEWRPALAGGRLGDSGFDLAAPVWAKYLKLEFYDLAPWPYEGWEEGAERVVSDWPQEVYERAQVSPPEARPSLPSYEQVGGWSLEGSEVGVPPSKVSDVQQAGAPVAGGRTAVDVWHDPVPGVDLGAVASQWLVANGQDFAQEAKAYAREPFNALRSWITDRVETGGSVARSFVQRSRHVYSRRVAKAVEKIAYFAGVREVRVLRRAFVARRDDEKIVETFGDTAMVASSTFEPEGIPIEGVYRMVVPPNRTTATFVSKPSASWSKVDGVKVLSQQRGARECVPDPHFVGGSSQWVTSGGAASASLDSAEGVSLSVQAGGVAPCSISALVVLSRGGRKRLAVRMRPGAGSPGWSLGLAARSYSCAPFGWLRAMSAPLVAAGQSPGQWGDFGCNFDFPAVDAGVACAMDGSLANDFGGPDGSAGSGSWVAGWAGQALAWTSGGTASAALAVPRQSGRGGVAMRLSLRSGAGLVFRVAGATGYFAEAWLDGSNYLNIQVGHNLSPTISVKIDASAYLDGRWRFFALTWAQEGVVAWMDGVPLTEAGGPGAEGLGPPYAGDNVLQVGGRGLNGAVDSLVYVNDYLTFSELEQLRLASEPVSAALVGSLTEEYALTLAQTSAAIESATFGDVSLGDDTVRWEVSTDAGATWTRLMDVVNMRDGMASLPEGDMLSVRLAAMSPQDWIVGYVLYPKYR